MVLAHGPGEHHADDIGGQHGLAVRPHRKRPKAKKNHQEVFRFEFRRPVPVFFEEPRREVRQDEEYDSADADKDQGLKGERREDQTQRKDCPEVGDEAGSEHCLAEVGFVQPQFKHNRVNHGNRCRREGNTREPACLRGPVKEIVRGCGAAEKRREEGDKADGGCFLELRLEYNRVKLRARKKGKNDRAGA